MGPPGSDPRLLITRKQTPAAGAKIIAGAGGDPFDSGVPSCQAEGRVHRRRRALLICFRLITELTPKAFCS